MNISIDDLANTITESVKQYTEDVTTSIEKEVDKTARRSVKLISRNSPKRKGKNGGRYANGWTRKKVTIGGEVSHKIYNKYKPGLTHLLEKGHAKRGGGRVDGKPHIAPVVDAEIPVMVNKIKSIIRDGG